ncbi:MAG TPA: hypothetical protein VF337_05400 [Candidatus Limnocylindrales bacterium]
MRKTPIRGSMADSMDGPISDPRVNRPAEGADGAPDSLLERLNGRFSIELARAERDYPRLRARVENRANGSRLRLWRGLRVVAACAAIVTIVGAATIGITLRNSGGPAAAAGPWTSAAASAAAASTVTTPWQVNQVEGLVTNGLPTKIRQGDIYQLWQRSKWAGLTGSFLLAAYKFSLEPCASSRPANPSFGPDAKLVAQCGGVELSPTPGNYTLGQEMVAPRGSEGLAGLPDGTAVVVSAHTNDPLAAQCAGSQRAACQAALVVEGVMWQGDLGTTTTPEYVAFETGSSTFSYDSSGGVTNVVGIDGVPVYSAGSTLPVTGSFLLGGRIARDPAACPAVSPGPLRGTVWPGCGHWTLAGEQMLQLNVNLDSLVGYAVVMRVYDAGRTTSCANGEGSCRVLAAVEFVTVEPGPRL